MKLSVLNAITITTTYVKALLKRPSINNPKIHVADGYAINANLNGINQKI